VQVEWDDRKQTAPLLLDVSAAEDMRSLRESFLPSMACKIQIFGSVDITHDVRVGFSSEGPFRLDSLQPEIHFFGTQAANPGHFDLGAERAEPSIFRMDGEARIIVERGTQASFQNLIITRASGSLSSPLIEVWGRTGWVEMGVLDRVVCIVYQHIYIYMCVYVYIYMNIYIWVCVRVLIPCCCV
jgi:hypothetical protein